MVYQFGYNTKAADQGNGTGTTTIDILGPAPDGGVTISGTDYWWNTARPRATNTCEVYASGAVKCGYFKGLNAGGTSSWTQTYTIYGRSFRGRPARSPATPIRGIASINSKVRASARPTRRVVAIDLTGTLTQEGGRYKSGTTKAQIAYDTKSKIPLVVQEVRSRLPQASVYKQDFVQVKLRGSDRDVSDPAASADDLSARRCPAKRERRMDQHERRQKFFAACASTRPPSWHTDGVP